MLKDSIYAARIALSVGIEYTQELLGRYDTERGRDHRTDRLAAEGMELEILRMKKALQGLDGPNGIPYAGSTPFATQGVRRVVDLNPES